MTPHPSSDPAPTDPGPPPNGEVSRWEWVVAAFGTLIVLAAVAFLLRDALGGRASAPDIAVRVDSVVETRGGYLVEFTLINSGHTTASALAVQAELSEGGGVVETSEVTVDYVPEQAERAAGVFFTRDPRRYELAIRPRGYLRP